MKALTQLRKTAWAVSFSIRGGPLCSPLKGLSVLLASLSVCTAAVPTSTAPFDIDGTLVPHVAYRYFIRTAAASNCFLLAWLDLRDTYDYFPRVYGTRVELDGTTTNFNGTPFSRPFQERWPNQEFDLASDGQNFLAIWHSASLADGGVRGVLIRNDAHPETNEILISTNVQARAIALTAYDGGYFVAWTEPRRRGRAIQAARIGKDGSVLDPNGVTLTSVTWDNSPIKIAGHGNTIVVAFGDSYPSGATVAFATLVTVDGTISATGPLPVSAVSQQTVQCAAWWHDRFLVVWSGGSPSSTEQGFWKSFIAPDGRPFAPSFIYAENSYISHVSLVPWNSGGILAWRASWSGTSYTEWRSSELDTNAVYLAHSPFASFQTSWPHYYPHYWPLNIAVSGDNLLVPRNVDSFVVRAQSSEIITNDSFIKSTPNQTAGEIGSNGKDYLVVWADDRWKTNWFLFGRRFDRDGNPLDTQSFQLDSYAIYSDVRTDDWTGRPAIASLRRDYLILLRNGYGHIRGKRVLKDGRIEERYLDLTPTATARQPKLAASTSRYLAVWESRLNADGNIQGRFVSADGHVGPLLELESTSAEAAAPCVASVGQNFLVIWFAGTGPFNRRLQGAVVTGSGRVRDLGEVAIPFGGDYALGATRQEYLFVSPSIPGEELDQVFGSFFDRRGRVLRSVILETTQIDRFSAPTIVTRKPGCIAVWNELSAENSTISVCEVLPGGNPVSVEAVGSQTEYAAYSAVAMVDPQSAMIVTETYGPLLRRTISGRIIRFAR